MKQYGPGSLTDQLFKSGLTLLATMLMLFAAWELASRLLGPLLVALVLLGAIRLTAGLSRRRDGW